MELRHILFALREQARRNEPAVRTLSGGLTVRVTHLGANSFRVDLERQGKPSTVEIDTVKREWLCGEVVRVDPIEQIGPMQRVGFVTEGGS